MRKHTAKKILSLVLILAMAVSLCPAALAAGKTVYATDPGGKEYYSIDEAWEAGLNGATIVLQRDWYTTEALELGTLDTVTVYMNGYKIDRSLTSSSRNGYVFWMDDYSNLILKGYDKNGLSKKTDISFLGWTESGRTEMTVNCGGVVTGGWNGGNGGGIYVEGQETNVYLDNVALVGNRSESMYGNGSGGGIYFDASWSYLTLRNGAMIAYNRADLGGGVFTNGEFSQITLANKSGIDYNYASREGGGLYSNDLDLYIWVKGKSSVSHNIAGESGGAMFASYSKFHIGSDDSSAQFSYNTARDGNGGAISMSRNTTDTNIADIKGVSFIGNQCSNIGGALYLYQEHIDIRSCVIQGNHAGSEGGGVYNDNDYNAITDTTITNNSAGSAGGGVYCSSTNDMGLSGAMIIKNNTRGDGSADDLYLNDTFFTTAYLTGAPNAGSEVGVRTDVKSGKSRKIGKSTDFDPKYFFSDVSGFRAQFDSEDQELWLNPTSDAHKVTVDGKVQGYYVGGSTVSVDTAEKEGSAFRQWVASSEEDTALLADATSMSTSFTMPDHDVSLTSTYSAKISEASLTVSKLKAGFSFPETATLHWEDETGTARSSDVSIYWVQELADGKMQIASGTVAYGGKYSVAAMIPQDPTSGMTFADPIAVSVKYSASSAQTAQTAKVADDGTLYILGHQFSVPKAKITAVYENTVNICTGDSLETLVSALPDTVYVEGEDRMLYSVPLAGSSDYATLLQDFLDDDGKVAGTDGKVSIALDLSDNETLQNPDGLTATVNIEIDPRRASPAPTVTFTGDTDNSLAVNALLGCDTPQDVTIHYAVYGICESDGAKFTLTVGDTSYQYDCISQTDSETETKELTCEPGTSIRLTAEHGTKTTFVLKAWTQQGSEQDYKPSAAQGYDYTIDDPLTLRIYAEDLSGASLLDAPKVSRYYKGEDVVVWMPTIDNMVFRGWKSLPESLAGKEEYFLIKLEKLSEDMELTATYSPYVTYVNLVMEVPTAGEALASTSSLLVEAAGADGKAYDVSEYLETIEWDTEDEIADYGTSYTAKLTFSDEGSDDYPAGELEQLLVNGDDENVLASATTEGDNYVVYLTFGVTEFADDQTPTYKAPDAKNLTCTGEDQELIRAGVARHGKMVYSLTKDGKYTDAIPTGNAVGEYTVWYKVLGAAGYCDTEPACVTVRIAEKGSGSSSGSSTMVKYPSTDEEKTEGCKQDASCPLSAFADLSVKAWYHDGVHDCLEKGLMEGVSATAFAPDADMTRAQIVTILWRTENKPSTDYTMHFQDVASGTWYTEAVRWAAANGIVTGYSEEIFAPDDAVTREQLAAILYRYAQSKHMDVSVGEDTNIMDYDDVKEISSYAVSAMQWAVGEGILTGTSRLTLSPKSTATRAQTACMLQRFAD